MCIIYNKQEDIPEKILIYYGLIIKCPNVFQILNLLALFVYFQRQKNS